jgi:hypothetical protein
VIYPMTEDVEHYLRHLHLVVTAMMPRSQWDRTFDVRLQMDDEGGWIIHWGLADYDTDHTGYWGSGTIAGSNTNFAELAADLISQAVDAYREQHA